MSAFLDSNFSRLSLLGLNNKEARTYLTLLRLGKGTVKNISIKANIARTTVYGHIKKLLKLGYIKQGFESGKTIFFAKPPSEIYFKQQQELKSTKNLVEELQSIYRKEIARSKIVFYEHIEGVFKAHEESLIYNKKRLTRFLGEVSSILDYYPGIDNYIELRKMKGIKNQVITTKDIIDLRDKYGSKTNSQNMRVIKYIEGIESMKTGLFMFDEIVWILPSKSEDFAVRIENIELASTFNNLFNFLWSIATKV